MVIFVRRFALHDVDDEQKDAMLTYHSEKIVIAFGLLSIVEGSTVRVLKNLRICGDSHSAIKLILKIIRQMVVLRDSISSLQGWVLFLRRLLITHHELLGGKTRQHGILSERTCPHHSEFSHHAPIPYPV